MMRDIQLQNCTAIRKPIKKRHPKQNAWNAYLLQGGPLHKAQHRQLQLWGGACVLGIILEGVAAHKLGAG